ncbi:MAG: hypothetical protein ACFFG0_52095, partial [Candidatus Thorarchaeota archaeon]
MKNIMIEPNWTLNDILKIYKRIFFFLTEVKNLDSNCSLTHINLYENILKFKKLFNFIDPGVHYLLKNDNYPHLKKLHKLASGNLLSNEFISIDYPGDMFPSKSQEFIKRSIQNNFKYADNPKYICTIQFNISRFIQNDRVKLPIAKPSINDFPSFKENFEILENIFLGKNKILGIGNLCRVFEPNKFMDKITSFLIAKSRGDSLFKNERKIKWIHFYGLSKSCIKRYIPIFLYNGIIVSADSLKWTRASSKNLRKKYMKQKNQTTLKPITWKQKGF